VLDSGTSQLSSWREHGEIKVLRRFLKAVNDVVLVMSAGRLFHKAGTVYISSIFRHQMLV